MELDKITLKIYHPEVKEFIEKGWFYFQEELEESKNFKNVLKNQIEISLKRHHTCLVIQSVFSEAMQPDKIYSDLFLAASFFCDLFQYSPKGDNCTEYSSIIAIGELEKVTLGPQKMPVFSTKWWSIFKKCLLYCRGTNNPLKMLNFDKPVSDLDVIFMLGYQLQTKGDGIWLTYNPSTEMNTSATCKSKLNQKKK